MRSLLLFIALLVGSLIVAAALTYPAWLAVGLISIEPIHRVMHRVAMLVALIGLVVLVRKLGLSNRESLGFGVPPRRFATQLALGWLCGLALMLPLTALLFGLDIRVLRPDVQVAPVIVQGLVSGLLIALIEETFFRGVLFSAVARTSGAIAAMTAPSVIYAAVHFLGGKLRIAPEDVTWGDGFVVLAKLLERYAQPFELVDSFLALWVLGVLLALVRHRTGAIAASMGLHAVGVATIAILREMSVVDPNARFASLVGSYDGIIGWAALLWFALIAAAYARFGGARAAPVTSQAG
jgi:membrane protease YdiL (CAAX protease family)